MRTYLIIAWLSAAIIFPHVACADPIDGASPCLCAIRTVIECDSQGNCQETLPETINIPTFIKVDFENRILSGLDKEESKTTSIKTIEKTDRYMVLQGDENHRAWTMMVNSGTGSMSASVSGEGFGFLLFGNCILFP